MCYLCRTNTVQKILPHSAPTNEPNRHQQRSTTMNTNPNDGFNTFDDLQIEDHFDDSIEPGDTTLDADDEGDPDDGPNYGNNSLDDAEALASAGFGTDEDYGYYGGDEW